MPISIPLTLRLSKGSKLTFAELDQNFINLKNAINSVNNSDTYVTGGTYNPSTVTLDFSGNTGFNPFSVDVSALLDDTNTFTTGATLNGTIIEFDRTDLTNAYSVDLNPILSAFSTTDYYTTGSTLNGTILEFDRTDLTNAYSVDLSPLKFTGNTSASCITDLYVSNIHSCSPLNINPLNEGNVYFGSANTLAVDVVNNRVGVKKSNPNYTLDVGGPIHSFGPGNTGSIIVEDTQPGGATIALDPQRGTGIPQLVTYNNFPIVLSTNNSERIRINSNGLVGIGTNSPSEKLEVSGKTKTTNFQMTSGATNGYVLTSDASGNATWAPQSVTGVTNFANTDLTLTGSRTHDLNGYDLVIGEGSSQTIGMFNGFATQITYDNSIWEIANNYQSFSVSGMSALDMLTNQIIVNNGGNDINFIVEGDTDQNLLFIDASSDRIGIGNNSPSEKLDVIGKTKTTSLQITSGATNGYVLTSDALGNATWGLPPNIYNSDGTLSSGRIIDLNGNSIACQDITGNGEFRITIDDGVSKIGESILRGDEFSVFVGDNQTSSGEIYVDNNKVELVIYSSNTSTVITKMGVTPLGVGISGKTKTTTLQITSGATNGYVLTSDSLGNATWQVPTGGGGVPEATTATTTTINFTGQTIYYNASSPGTGNISGNLTGAKLGLIQKIYHNSGTAPTYPAGWVLMGDAIYFTSTLNIIYAEWAGGTRVEYWYVQQQ